MTSIRIAVATLAVLTAQPDAASAAAAPPQAGRAQTPPPGWRETTSKTLDLSIAGRDQEVLAIYEAWVAKHPGFSEGHFMLGGAHESIARGLFSSRAPDARATRTKHLEAAAVHMRRGLELAGPDASFLMVRSLIDLHGAIGLDRPAEYERLVRDGVARYPAEPLAHAYFLALLASKGEPIEAAARAARAGIPSGPGARVRLAGSLVAQVGGVGRLTPALGPALLPEASRLIDEALALKPGDAGALRVRGDIQAAQARVPGRPEADEVGVRGVLRAIVSAQAAYVSGCGRGHYAPTLAVLARPEPGRKASYLADLVPAAGATFVEKHHYRIEMMATPSPTSTASCHGVPAGGSADTFSVVARPLAGFQGRTFRIAADGTLTDSQ